MRGNQYLNNIKSTVCGLEVLVFSIYSACSFSVCCRGNEINKDSFPLKLPSCSASNTTGGRPTLTVLGYFLECW